MSVLLLGFTFSGGQLLGHPSLSLDIDPSHYASQLYSSKLLAHTSSIVIIKLVGFPLLLNYNQSFDHVVSVSHIMSVFCDFSTPLPV